MTLHSIQFHFSRMHGQLRWRSGCYLKALALLNNLQKNIFFKWLYSNETLRQSSFVLGVSVPTLVEWYPSCRSRLAGYKVYSEGTSEDLELHEPIQKTREMKTVLSMYDLVNILWHGKGLLAFSNVIRRFSSWVFLIGNRILYLLWLRNSANVEVSSIQTVGKNIVP